MGSKFFLPAVYDEFGNIDYEKASLEFFKEWSDEVFFLTNNMPGLGGIEQILRMPVYLRKTWINKYIKFKEKEAAELDKIKNR